MFEKKYYSIAETSKSTSLPIHKLRYIEKTDKKINIVQIRGRRYFTKQDIIYINSTYTSNNLTPIFNAEQKKLPKENGVQNTKIISQIDQLIHNLNKIKKYN